MSTSSYKSYKIIQYENRIEVSTIKDFSLKDIFSCGQCFRWLPTDDGNGYIGVVKDRVARMYFNDGTLTIFGANYDDFCNIWYDYLDLGTDYGLIKKQLAAIESNLDAAVNFGAGIRILKQEPFETLISFIISANNNIPRIRGIIEKLAKQYGEKIEFEKKFYRKFPECEILGSSCENELSLCCHAGYRCAYIEKTCKQFMQSPFESDMLKNMSLAQARKFLLGYMGVGNKVADCILLFTGSHLDAFPVDVWVKRVMQTLYFQKEISIKQVELFAHEHFGDLAGYAQQYLFYYAREKML